MLSRPTGTLLLPLFVLLCLLVPQGLLGAAAPLFPRAPDPHGTPGLPAHVLYSTAGYSPPTPKAPGGYPALTSTATLPANARSLPDLPPGGQPHATTSDAPPPSPSEPSTPVFRSETQSSSPTTPQPSRRDDGPARSVAATPGGPAAPTPSWGRGSQAPLDEVYGGSSFYEASFVYDAYDGYSLFVGEEGLTSQMQTWSYFEGAWTNLTSSQAQVLPAGYGVEMTYDAADQYVVLFDDGTWIFENGQWQADATTPTPPLSLFGEGMTYDAGDHEVLLFGGSYCVGETCAYTNATWAFQGGTWSNITSRTLGVSPSPRRFPSMADDSADGYVLLFGGNDPAGNALSDTWKFTGGRWTSVPSSGVPARFGAPMAYDATDGYVLLFGGSAGSTGSPSSLDDSWEYRGGTWTEWFPSTSPQPELGVDEVMDYDGASGYVVLVEGPYTSGGFSTNESVAWSWPAPLALTASASASSLDANQSVLISMNATGGARPLSYSWGILPAGCTTLSSTQLNCTPTAAGALQLTGSVTDAGDRTASSQVSVEVLQDPIVTTPTPSKGSIDIGSTVSFSSIAAQGSGGFTYNWTVPKGLGCANSTGPSVSCLPTSISRYAVRVRAIDSNGYSAVSGSASFVVNSGVSVNLAENRSNLDLGQSVFFWANASGGTGTYTYTYNALPPGCSNQNSSTLVCSPNTIGNYGVSVSVVDTGGGSASSGTVGVFVHSSPSFSSYWLSGSQIYFESGSPTAVENDSGTYQVNFTGGTPSYRYCLFTTPATPYDYCTSPSGSTTFQWGIIFDAGDGMTPGTYQLKFTAEDAAEWNDSVTLDLVVVYPFAQGGVHGLGIVDEQEMVTLSDRLVYGIGPYSYWLNDTTAGTVLGTGTSATPTTASITFRPTWQGSDLLQFYARDSTGAHSSSVFVLQVYPTLVPSFTSVPPEGAAPVPLHVLVNVSGGDPGYLICLQATDGTGSPCVVESSAIRPASFWVNATAPGTMALEATIRDSLGQNESIWTNVTIAAPLSWSGVAIPDWTIADSITYLTASWAGGVPDYSVWINDTTGAFSGCDWTPSDLQIDNCSLVYYTAGESFLSVVIRDSLGEQVSTEVTMAVYAPLEVRGLNVTVGTIFEEVPLSLNTEVGAQLFFSASFGGGRSPYQIFWFVNSLNASWAQGTYHGSNFSWSPTAAGVDSIEFSFADPHQDYTTFSLEVSVAATPSEGDLSDVPDQLEVGMKSNLSLTYLGGIGPVSFTFDGPTGPHSAVFVVTKVPWTTWTWLGAGQFDLQAIMTDADGVRLVVWQNFTVVPRLSVPCAPTLGNASAVAGQSLAFDLTCVEGGFSPDTLTWSWGDGNNTLTSGDAAGHIFVKGGTYTITVLVLDQAGIEANATLLTLVVASTPKSPTPSGSLNEAAWTAIGVLVLVIAVVLLAWAVIGRRSRRDRLAQGEGTALAPSTRGGSSSPGPVASEQELRQAAEVPSTILKVVGDKGSAGLSDLRGPMERFGLSDGEVLSQLLSLQKEGRLVLLPQSEESSSPVYALSAREKAATAPGAAAPTSAQPELDESMLNDYLDRKDRALEPEGDGASPSSED